ncbi:MAG: TRAP transporter small permease subunit [Tabrizicola sp.]
MRRALDLLYAATGVLACLALVAILGLVLSDVVMRQFGGQVKSADDMAGFALAAAGALALGPTYRRGGHVRVGMLIDRLTGRLRQGVEIAVALFAILCVGWATLWMARFAAESHRYGEVTSGLLALPLWPAQAVMVAGLLVFLIALVDDLVVLLGGGTPGFAATDPDDIPTLER